MIDPRNAKLRKYNKIFVIQINKGTYKPVLSTHINEATLRGTVTTGPEEELRYMLDVSYYHGESGESFWLTPYVDDNLNERIIIAPLLPWINNEDWVAREMRCATHFGFATTMGRALKMIENFYKEKGTLEIENKEE